MVEIELRPTNLHWIEGADPFADCCVHGGIYIRIGQTLVSDGKDDSWTVSTAAFNFLRSIFHDHHILGEEPLVPHCGHAMWLSESQPDGLFMPNCDSNINWSILHTKGQIRHEFKDGTVCETSLAVWTEAVCRFADDICKFYQTAWPKVIVEVIDREGFELFIRLWQERRAAAKQFYASSSDS